MSVTRTLAYKKKLLESRLTVQEIKYEMKKFKNEMVKIKVCV